MAILLLIKWATANIVWILIKLHWIGQRSKVELSPLYQTTIIKLEEKQLT